MALIEGHKPLVKEHSFFDLPLEIRHEIYTLLFVVDQPVVLHRRYGTGRGPLWEYVITLNSVQALKLVILQYATARTQSRRLGTALLLASKAIRHEAIPIIVSKNHIAIRDTTLTCLKPFTLGTYCKGIYSQLRELTILTYALCDGLTEDKLSSIRDFVDEATNLTKLHVLVDWFKFDPSAAASEEKFIRFFGALSRLPLQEAKVQDIPDSFHRNADKFPAWNRRAERFLLDGYSIEDK